MQETDSLDIDMQYTIIEDCSPYYIRFTHDGIDEFISCCTNALGNISNFPKWMHYNMSRFNLPLAHSILDSTPLSKDLSLRKDRVSYFVSGPGFYYRAHKDGWPGDRYSLNYTLSVKDEKCVTNWYNDEDLENYPIQNYGVAGGNVKNSRECVGFDKLKHTPIKSMIAKQGECILFNTDIFHDFDNRESENYRVILTLRNDPPDSFYFEDARKVLFGY
jgi:hypothetical protein